MMINNNQIHPTAIIGENVSLGSNNTIGPFSIIEGNTIIGDNNTIGPHVVIGCEPTDSKHIERNIDSMILRIGNNNIIREYSLIELPCYENETIVGNNVFLMQGVHISHDVHLLDNVTITNFSVLAGIVKVLQGADIAMSCSINQYTTIGHYSICATNAAVMKNVKPFSRFIPNKPISVNYYAIKKFGFEEYTEEIENYVLNGTMPTSKIIVLIINEFDQWVAKYGHNTYE
jgi:UDP-N-acetylglucosamine acyltransferase